ncbi:hypothetical protein CYMTET_52765 [Cymbomonas tetramitiformis]|uniref:Uncharacterized protein n=1 Tax=Cymbomonas tetramitiformis TaxID=36881 RepID=A0AAE0BIE0_9CHLO|nr:hypothetical protein CYMTET_52765 [Cymbomonas tetramitiformis]
MRVICEAPDTERETLLDFLVWAKTIHQEFGFHHFTEFYEHLVRRVRRSWSSIGLNDYDTVWRVYAKQFDVRPTKKPDKWSNYRRQDTTKGEQAGGEGKGGKVDKGKGKGKGKGGKGTIRDARYPHNHGTCERGADCKFRHVCSVCGAADHVRAAAAYPGRRAAMVGWTSGRRREEYIRVWNVQGGHWGHGMEPTLQLVERLVPMPVSMENPELWRAHSQEARVRSSSRWPSLRQRELAARATVETMERCGTMEAERRCYEEEIEKVGCVVPLLTRRAHCVAAAFHDWHDVQFLVRSAACGTGWAYEDVEFDEPYRVPNYV